MNRKLTRDSAALTALKVFASLLFLTGTLLAAHPAVMNVTAVQRAGTALVDITYDVTADTPTVAVILRISSDGGATFDVPATTLSGAVGPNVPVGTGKVITWNAGADWLGNYSNTMRFEITANGGFVAPDSEQFSLIEAGAFQMGVTSGDTDSDAPSVSVTTSSFYMAKYETTKGLWDEVRNWGWANGYDDLTVGFDTSADHPVGYIPWHEAVKWCNARSEKEGLTPCYTYTGTGVIWETINMNNADFDLGVSNGPKGFDSPTNVPGWTDLHPGSVIDSGVEGPGAWWGPYDQYAAFMSTGDGAYNLSSHQIQEGDQFNISFFAMWWNWTGAAGRWKVTLFYDNPSNIIGTYLSPSLGTSWSPYSTTSSIAATSASVGHTLGILFESIGGGTAQMDEVRLSVFRAPVSTARGSIYRIGKIDYVNCDWSANGYRLPTEAEWEKAARGGVRGKRFPWGSDTISHSQANYKSSSSFSYDLSGSTNSYHPNYDDGIKRTSPVGSFAANGYGLHDMAGNSAEWCWDRYMASTYVAMEGVMDPRGPALDPNLNVLRVFRGGSSVSDSSQSRSAHRRTHTAGSLGVHLGFRLARGSAGIPVPVQTTNAVVNARYWILSTMAEANGVVVGAGNYVFSTPATLTAVPNPGFRFAGWTGDASGSDNPLTITMDSNKTVGATFEKDLSDADADGLTAYDELVLTRTNPLLADSDGDGINDSDADQDGDGLSNRAELSYPGSYFTLVEGSFTHAQATADAATRRGRLASFPNANDFTRAAGRARKTTQGYLWLGLSDAATEGTWLWSDGNAPAYTRWLNGQPDGGTAENHAVLMENTTQWADAVADFVAAGYLFERVGLDPLASDTDGDGLSDGAEVNNHQTNPVLDDSDSDGLTDGAEINTHSSNPKLADTDSDGLSDFAEVVTHGTNPAAKDSDGDGFDDLFEINTGFNPTLDSSTPDAASGIQTAVKFWFNAAQGVSYRIEASTDLETWETIEAVVVGEGGRVTRFYDIENQPKRYFRVKRN